MLRVPLIIAKIIGWILVGIFGLVLLVAFAIQLPPVRGLIRDQILAAARGSVQGEIELEDVRWPSIEHLEISGLTVKDRKGKKALALTTLTVDLSLPALISGTVDVRSVAASNVYVDLADLGDETGLLSLFASDKPGNEPAKPKDPNAPMSPISVAIRELCLDHGEVRVQPSADQAFEVDQLDGCVRLRIAKGFYVATNVLTARVQRNGKPLAMLRPGAEMPALRDEHAGQRLLASVDAKLEILGEDMSFDAWVKARGFSPETLRTLGIETDVLTRKLNLDLHARQLKGVLGYRAEIDSRAGRIDARGELDKQKVLTAHVLSPALKLAEVSSLGLPKLGFALDAEAALGNPKQTELRASLTRGFFDNFKLPVVNVQAVQQQSGKTVLHNVKASYGDAVVTGNGELEPSGALRAEVKLDVPELADVPPLKAAGAPVRGDVRAQVNVVRDQHDAWDGRVSLGSGGLSAGATQAQQIKLDAHMSMVVARPVVELTLNVGELATGGQVFNQVGVTLDGGPQRYQFRAACDEDKLRAEGWVEPAGMNNAWDGGLDAHAKFPQGDLRVRVPRLKLVPSESVQLSGLLAEFSNAKLRADGRVAFEGASSKLKLSADVPDMVVLLRALGQQEIPGKLSLNGSLQGELQRPVADLELNYRNGPKFAGEASKVTVELHAKAPRGTSDLKVSASAGSARLDTHVASTWSRSLPLSAAFQSAKHKLELTVRDAPLASLLDPKSPLPSRLVDGPVQADISAEGNLDKLQLEAEVRSRLRISRDKNSIDAVIKADYRDAQTKLAVDVGDRRGQLWALRAATQLAIEKQIKKPTPPPELIHALPWEFDTELSERMLGELPYLASEDLSDDLAPMRVAFKAQLGHAPHTEPSGTAEVQMRWEPTRVKREPESNCVAQLRGRALLAAKWADQKLGVELSGGAKTNETVQVSGRARVPFNELMNGGIKDLGGIQLAAKLRDLKLEEVPVICNDGRGQVDVDVEASDMLTPRAKVSARVGTKAVVWQGSPDLNLSLEASTIAKALLVKGDMQSGAGKTHIEGRAPIDVHASKPELMVRRSDPAELDLRMEKMPMATLLAPVPIVARVSGSTSGQMRLRGSIDKPAMKGDLKLDDVSFTLPRMGQRFSHLNLKAVLDGDTLRLSEGRVKDLDGSASIAALVQLQTLDSWKAEVNLNARNFPLRKSGVILGRADLDAKLKAEATREKTDVGVNLNDVAIILNGEDMSDVQSLDPHPDFGYVDERVAGMLPEPALPVDDALKPGEPKPTPTYIRVVSKDGVWVRRDDFAVEMQTDLTVEIAEKTPRLKGEIKLLRGYISLFGQNFDIKRGRVVLAGGETVDPQLEITAQHDTPGGGRVRVEVTGFAREPKLAFYVDDRSVTARDALVAITGGRGSAGKGSAESQIAAAAVGMTTGLLTLGARREFGDWVPMLAIEQGDNTRVRVGIEADKFIPNVLKGFVRGAYVEGIVATQSTANTRGGGGAAGAQGGTGSRAMGAGNAMTQSGTGVLLELMLPSHFVWAGQYGPGTAWSIDLDWRP